MVLNAIREDAEERMKKSLSALHAAFAKIRTGRAHPGILTGITVDYYGNEIPLDQVANISVEDARTLMISPWEKPMATSVAKSTSSTSMPSPTS